MSYSGFYKTGPSQEEILRFFGRGQPESKMKDVTPPGFRATPKPRTPTVQLHQNNIAGPGCYEIMMPNGIYLAGTEGVPYLLRFKGGYDTASRREITVEKFTKVYENFRRFWP